MDHDLDQLEAVWWVSHLLWPWPLYRGGNVYSLALAAPRLPASMPSHRRYSSGQSISRERAWTTPSSSRSWSRCSSGYRCKAGWEHQVHPLGNWTKTCNRESGRIRQVKALIFKTVNSSQVPPIHVYTTATSTALIRRVWSNVYNHTYNMFHARNLTSMGLV